MTPYQVLGVRPDADLATLTAARRRLARELHPDRGGDLAAMQRVNAAYSEAVGRLRDTSVSQAVAEPPARPDRPSQRIRRRVQFDVPSFTLDVLPAEAFEALLVVSTWIGEVLVDEPPYALEVLLHEPMRCWCRLELVPDAGGTTVSLVVQPEHRVIGAHSDPPGEDEMPDVERVRDLWVTCLNEPLW